MAFKVFLDANVLLDFTLKRKEYYATKKLFELIVSKQLKGFITPDIVHIAGYWLTKAYGAKESKKLLLSILADVQSVDIPHDVVINALLSNSNDIQDALQYYSALHHNLDFFISEDKLLKKQSNPILPVYTVKEFLEEFGFV
jgi:predicted nucleic acid-binding protein